MNTVELRHNIKEKIELITDDSFLKALLTIIEAKTVGSNYSLNEQQLKRVEEGRIEFQNRKTIANDTLESEIDQWLDSI
ncbi:MAG: hypothetical protein JEZ14_08715 [Marinilabiliaceae bacterium]|nr:hypothetical protein [Marinilabiliaceae bacterium]